MSESTHIKNVLPSVVLNIEARCNRDRKEHGLPSLGEEKHSKQNPDAKASSERAFLAVQDFFSGQKANRRTRRRLKQKALF